MEEKMHKEVGTKTLTHFDMKYVKRLVLIGIKMNTFMN